MKCDAAHRSLTSMKGRTLTLKGSSAVGPSARMPLPNAVSERCRRRFEVMPARPASPTVKGLSWNLFGNGRAVFMAT